MEIPQVPNLNLAAKDRPKYACIHEATLPITVCINLHIRIGNRRRQSSSEEKLSREIYRQLAKMFKAEHLEMTNGNLICNIHNIFNPESSSNMF